MAFIELVKLNIYVNVCSLVYFDIEAVIDDEVFVVGLAISEQYSLHKMWTDITDVCWGHPIRDANGIKVQVMLLPNCHC